MKLIHKLLLIITFMLIIYTPSVHAEKTVDIYFFYGDGCAHCAHEEEALDRLKERYNNLKVHYYETWYNSENAKFLDEVGRVLNINITGVPFTVIGEKHYTGFDKFNSEKTFASRIEYYTNNEYNNQIGDYIAGRKVKPVETEEPNSEDNSKTVLPVDSTTTSVKIPIVGEVNLRELSLPVIAIVLGALDGFNPCAMWILLFLISMLIGMENRRRMWILGIVFLVTSAAVYMLFMLAWLSFTAFIGTVMWLRLLIAGIAIAGGLINLKNYFDSRNVDGCNVVDDKKRKKLFSNIKKITHEKKFFLALIGIILLAASVNVIELACSAGFPVVFTSILTANGLTGAQHIAYVLLYIFFFLLDDLIIFGIAMLTMEVTGISTKYGRMSHLIGGIVMLLVGLLMIFKPEFLMFNF